MNRLLTLTTFLPVAGVVVIVVGEVPHGEGLAVWVLGTIGATVAIVGLALTWLVYASRKVDARSFEERLEPLPRTLRNGWYWDEAYSKLLVVPGKAGARITAFVVDAKWVDGLVNGVGRGVSGLAQAGRLVQTGFVRSYALAFLVGAVALLAWIGVRL